MPTDTVSNAIKALERAGILEVMRRIVRERCRVWIEEPGRFLVYDRLVQTTNAYMARSNGTLGFHA